MYFDGGSMYSLFLTIINCTGGSMYFGVTVVLYYRIRTLFLRQTGSHPNYKKTVKNYKPKL